MGKKETPLKHSGEMTEIVPSLWKQGDIQKINNLKDLTRWFTHRQKVKGCAGFFVYVLFKTIFLENDEQFTRKKNGVIEM